MIPEIGHFALIMALCLALVQGTLPLIGAQRRIASWIALARPAAYGQFFFIALAFACLTYSFVVSDFSVLYVAQNSNSELPLLYRVSGVWGAHEGSLLLWAVMLAGWTIAVGYFSRSLPADMAARTIAVMGLVSIGFLLFMLATSNPFDRLFPAPADGRDLNPLLQDPGLALHPPMLYMGYVGFSVVFALAIAALLGGHIDAPWARWSRPWTAVSWVFLTLGITLGSWWAYYELGWGGWWFWDPVENASFMPWLVGTALLHSLAVTDKRGAFKSWTVLLAIFAFSLSLLGTFLVRSGVLVSVHAFATDPSRGIFILIFLCLVIGGSLALYAWRAPRLKGGGNFELFSRETLLLANNVLLTVATLTVLLGTLYPLILDALNLGKISVGPPYFDSVFVPLMLPMVVLVGVASAVRWKQSDPRDVVRRLRYVGLVSIVAGSGVVFVFMDHATVMIVVASVLGVWAILTPLHDLWNRLSSKGAAGPGARTLPRHFLGMTLAHIGIGVFILGVTFTSSYSVEKDLRMAAGDTVVLAGYTFRFDGVRVTPGPNYQAAEGTLQVSRDGKPIAVLHPQKRIYRVQGNPMTEAAIDAGLFRDLYVALGEQLSNNAWSVRIHYKPFVRWIWLGGLFMAVGGVVAASDRRYRLAARRRRAALEPGTAAMAGGKA